MDSFSEQENKKNDKQKKNSQDESNNKSQTPIDPSLSVNLDNLKKKTGNSADIVIRPLKTKSNPEVKIAVVYVKGLVDNQSINDFLIESIMKSTELNKEIDRQEMFNMIPAEVVSLGSVKPVSDWEALFTSLLSGNTIIFVDGISEALDASTQGGNRRSVQESATSVSVRGSREGFTESAETNIAMVRRIINDPSLWIESMDIGKVTKTKVSMMYIDGLARKDIVEQIRSRLKKIDIDGILDSGYIEQLIEDQSMTSFPTLYNTDRPDTVAGNLLEGRIAIFVNGTPFVLLAPAIFIQFFQSAEDYYQRFDISSMLRFLRVAIFFVSLLGPATYLAITTFHQEMIPTQLLIIIAAQRESVPFPAVVEAFLMELTFEVLREAGIRMPKAIGSTVSIVGGLVIGQAAVQAGIVSPAMVIVVSITAIASFATPSYSMAISVRLIRFAFMISAAMFGFYGVFLALIMLLVHLCSLRSFGVPYMVPFAPLYTESLGDTIFKRPLWTLKDRPPLISAKNTVREGQHQKPSPPDDRTIRNYTVKGEGNET